MITPNDVYLLAEEVNVHVTTGIYSQAYLKYLLLQQMFDAARTYDIAWPISIAASLTEANVCVRDFWDVSKMLVHVRNCLNPTQRYYSLRLWAQTRADLQQEHRVGRRQS